ncbi:hypothetical protein HC891_19065 [Candidatus Gracilibacteria bacterium]|nr:hypothetical protein [Candidatus Gracilibacteria bacterium]
MQSLSLPARLYLLLVCLLSAFVAIAALHTIDLIISMPYLSIACLLAFGLADYFEVLIEIDPENKVGITVYEAICIFLCGIYGFGGIWIVALGMMLAEFCRRRPIDRIIFNVSMIVLCYMLSAATFSFYSLPGLFHIAALRVSLPSSQQPPSFTFRTFG